MVTQTTLTLAEFLHLPEEKPALEFAGGEVVPKAMPTKQHGIVQSRLSIAFVPVMRSYPGSICMVEVRCNLGPPQDQRSLVPDFVFLAPGHPDLASEAQHLEHPPTLAVEVVSPSDRIAAVLRKARFYLACGVPQVWVIEPGERYVIDLRTDGSVHMLIDGDTLGGGPDLPDLRIPVSDLLPPGAVPTPLPIGDPVAN